MDHPVRYEINFEQVKFPHSSTNFGIERIALLQSEGAVSEIACAGNEGAAKEARGLIRLRIENE